MTKTDYKQMKRNLDLVWDALSELSIKEKGDDLYPTLKTLTEVVEDVVELLYKSETESKR